MSSPALTRLAMAIAAAMFAHHVAAKAVRDAVFLSTWGATRLPLMVIVTAVVVVATVPLFSRLLARFGPRVVVPAGLVLSACGHALEWMLWDGGQWLAVVLYLHVAGLSSLLLSGFWSLVSEVFDPASAKASFGRISAAGTLGGLSGGVASERIAAMLSEQSTLLLLAALHAVAAATLLLLSRRPASGLAPSREGSGRIFELDVLRNAPHLRTLALLIVLGTAGAGILDFLLKEQADSRGWTSGDLLRFFAVYHTGVQLLTFLAQTAVGPAVKRLGLGRTVSSLPIGLGVSGTITLLFPAFPLFVAARAVESVLRGSLFRSGYELLFVPMDPAEKRRTKTFLDVTCDRAGDALGGGVVQVLLLILAESFLTSALLGIVIATAAASIWLSGRLDVMYRRVVERRLVGQLPVTPAVIGSETAWTIVELPVSAVPDARDDGTPAAAAPSRPQPVLPPGLQTLAELRSGDRARVQAALVRIGRPDAGLVAQVIDLLAWDDVVAHARRVLESAAPRHVGLLTDALLNPDTDFAIRRRIPRILANVDTQRALDGLVAGLDDPRFEVRYQCARAIDRSCQRNETLGVSRRRILEVVERELSVPAQIWRGHRVIDDEDAEDGPAPGISDRAQRGTEHVFSLLATILAREPLTVAFSGLRSSDRALRSVALEYFDNELPRDIGRRLDELIDPDTRAGIL